MLRRWLEDQTGSEDAPLFVVEASDRPEDSEGDDIDLGRLGRGEFDQLWLFAVDVTGALTPGDVAAIERFRLRGGGSLLTRDHFDMGSCLARLSMVGMARHFHAVNPEADSARQARDDSQTAGIDWPNYHFGANGDFQLVRAIEPVHPVQASGPRAANPVCALWCSGDELSRKELALT